MTTISDHVSDGEIVPSASGRTLITLLSSVRRDRLGLMRALAREMGDASRFRLGRRELYFFNHPDHAKHVLVDNAANYRKGIGLRQARRVLGDGLLTSEGPVWTEQRRAFLAILLRERPVPFAETVSREALAHLDRWPVDEPVELTAAVGELTLSVVERTLIDADLGPKRDLIAALSAVQEQVMFDMVTLGCVPHWLPIRRMRRYRSAQGHLEGLVKRLRAGHDSRGPSQAMSRDELVTLLLTSHETTASALAWTLYELARHPDSADLVADEARAAFRTIPGADPARAVRTLDALPFTAAVVREAIRLHPPVWLLPRQSLRADRVGGFRVGAGTDVVICPYTLHRHVDFWDQPDRFLPDRFMTPADRVPRHRFAYLPFGAGPRVCPAGRVGVTEVVIVAALVARDRRLTALPPTPREGTPLLTLTPGPAVRILAARRR